MLALVASGLHRYFFSFSLTATSIHLLSAALVLLITGIHLYQHHRALWKHVLKITSNKWQLFFCISSIVTLSILTYYSVGPVEWLMNASYESRHRVDIFRTHKETVFQELHRQVKINRSASGVNILINCELNQADRVVLALWAESNGDMIEPLYLSPMVAYSNKTRFKGVEMDRKNLLPVFFDAYSRMKKRLNSSEEEVDGVSSATITGSFSLDSLFESQLKQFTVILEVNVVADENESFSSDKSALISTMPVGVGVPSLLYQSDIDLYEDKKYYLMERLGRSDLSTETPSIIYDIGGMGQALKIIEKVMIEVEHKKN